MEDQSEEVPGVGLGWLGWNRPFQDRTVEGENPEERWGVGPWSWYGVVGLSSGGVEMPGPWTTRLLWDVLLGLSRFPRVGGVRCRVGLVDSFLREPLGGDDRSERGVPSRMGLVGWDDLEP